MHRERMFLALITVIATVVGGGATPGRAAAATPAAPAVEASDAWIRWLPGDLPAAGYVTLRNVGPAPLSLTGAASADYGMAMLHESRSEHDVERMLPVEAIRLDPHGVIRLAPNGYHLMLTAARRSVRPGDHVIVTLQFKGVLSLPVTFEVRGADGQPVPTSGSRLHP